MFDFIGDIHRHADKLIELLEKLGYSLLNDVYYSVAKNGCLVAYSFDGEKELSGDKFTFVRAS